MSEHPWTPASRLICFGSARALTNSPVGDEVLEDDIGDFFDPPR